MRPLPRPYTRISTFPSLSLVASKGKKIKSSSAFPLPSLGLIFLDEIILIFFLKMLDEIIFVIDMMLYFLDNLDQQGVASCIPHNALEMIRDGHVQVV